MSYERFVQVECGLPNSKLIDKAIETLDIEMAEAVGLFVCLWIAALALRTGGDLSERSDRWIEGAAGWRGDRGAFARFVREHHLDEHGLIRDFEQKYGKLDVERRKATDLKREQRRRAKLDSPVVVGSTSTGQTDDSPRIPSISQSVSPVLDLEQGKGEREREGEEARVHRAALAGVAERFGDYAGPVMALIRASRSPTAVAAVILAHLDGMHGPAYEPETIALAATEYAASNEAAAKGFQPRLFAGYVRRAEGTVKLTDSRKQQQSETRFIAAVVNEDRRVRDEIDADEKVIADYMVTRGLTAADEMHARAESLVPAKWKGSFREPMVRAEMAKLIREEVRRAAS